MKRLIEALRDSALAIADDMQQMHDDSKPDLTPGKWCYAIVEGSKDDNGYIPVVVSEDKRGYWSMLGNGVGAEPWYWGKTIAKAQSVCDVVNARMGISPDRAAIIVASSFRGRLD